MNRKVVLGIMLSVIIISTLSTAFNLPLVRAQEPPIEVWSDYTLNRDITFAGDGFIVKADNVTLNLNGHTITGNGEGRGTDLTDVNEVTVKNGRIKNFYFGIYLLSADGNTITGNTVTNNVEGIVVRAWSDGNTITGNMLTNNWDGIYLDGSQNNFLRNNTMAGNLYNFRVGGLDLPHFINDIDTSNKVNGKPICYWVNERNRQVPSDAGYVAIVNSTGIIVRDLTLKENGQGVLFAYTTNSAIEKVNVSNNEYGIYLLDSGNNFLRDNSMAGNLYNFRVDGLDLPHFINDIDTSNKVNGKPIYYLINQRNLIIDPSTFPNVGYLAVINSTNITVRGLTLGNNGQGVTFAYTRNSAVENVNASNNWFGIYLCGSRNNTMNENILADNIDAIRLTGSDSNTITRTKSTNNLDGIFLLGSDNNAITGNTFNNNGMAGIHLAYSENNTITENTVTNNRMEGMRLEWSDSNILTENTLTNNGYGIRMDSSHSNTIEYNTISNSTDDGIELHSSNRNVLKYNKALNNSWGIVLNASSFNIINNNEADNTIIGIVLADSSINQLSGNQVSNNFWGGGISLINSSDNTLIDNTASNNSIGIEVAHSTNNMLIGNIASTKKAGGTGILLYHSSYNKLYHNALIDNPNQVYSEESVNTWDDGYPSGGNYWSNYAGVDVYSGPHQNETGSDGIGDTPYIIDANNTDRYPLMEPWCNVAIIEVTTSKITTYDTILYVTVFAKIEGYFSEEKTFDVSAYHDSDLIETSDMIMYDPPWIYWIQEGGWFGTLIAPGDLIIIPFRWNTTTLPKGSYVINAYVSAVPGETVVADNTYIDGTVKEVILGDITGDGTVNILDIAAVARAYGSSTIREDINHDGIVDEIDYVIVGLAGMTTPEHPRWNPDADINDDGKVDVKDLAGVKKAAGLMATKNWNPNADWDNNRVIDIRDIAKTAKNFGKTT